jgi:hypothetical protein
MEYNQDPEATEPLLTRAQHKQIARSEWKQFVVAYTLLAINIGLLVAFGVLVKRIVEYSPLVRNAANGCATVCCPVGDDRMYVRPLEPKN